jgi:hypothetical protein
MAATGPQGRERVLEHEYRYSVADEWIERKIDETGIEPPKTWRIEFQLRELRDADVRRRARRLREMWSSIPGDMVLSEPTEDPEEFLDLLEAWIDERAEDVPPVGTVESKEVRRRMKLADFDLDMDHWIDEQGSERLKIARSRNYKITSSYAKERAREELPECWVDTAGKAISRERVDPSMRALRVETKFREWIESKDLGLGTRIVWLVKPPPSMAEFFEYEDEDLFDPESGFQQQEALLISDYLGKYNAYLPVQEEQRAPRKNDPYWKEHDEEEDE